jgi:signal transduction histidine kinase
VARNQIRRARRIPLTSQPIAPPESAAVTIIPIAAAANPDFFACLPVLESAPMIELARTFIELNRDIIYFVYGLSFFILGLGIALQSRHASRLDLARILSWLAVFGFAHGFHEWGDYFIPIQATYLSQASVQSLQALRLILLALSFNFLFEFGVRLMSNQPRYRWLTAVNAGLFMTWASLVFLVLPRTSLRPQWIDVGDALARYLIGLPGGLLAAYGLRRHTHQRITPLNVPHIVRALRVAGVTLGLYGLLGGLIVAPVPFFPGNVVNSRWFADLFLVPPAVPRSILGLVMAVTILRALEIFDVEAARKMEALERDQILSNERARMAREIHDGAVQKVYSAGLLVESLKNQIPASDPAIDRVQQAVQVIDEAISDLRRNVLQLQPKVNRLPLIVRLRSLANDPRFGSFLDVTLDADVLDKVALSPERAEHVAAVVTEAMSNAVRHARANTVSVRAEISDNLLTLVVEDDGVGIPAQPKAGLGLRNMRDRARLLEGTLAIDNTGGGTTVRLRVPLEDGGR